MATKTLTLWSRRNSPARGNFWQEERKVTEETVQQWLKVFRDDEPGVLFLAAARKPSDK
jgi:hypothetical protein